ncbi:MAG: STAS domain-containing protein [Armatimonadota bacterium]
MNSATCTVELSEPQLSVPSTFHVTVASSGDAAVARVEGPVDLETSAELVERLESLSGRANRLVLDLQRVDYVDSTGVRSLMQLQTRLRSRRAELRLVVMPGSRVHRTLSLLRLEDYFPIFDTAADACARRTEIS